MITNHVVETLTLRISSDEFEARIDDLAEVTVQVSWRTAERLGLADGVVVTFADPADHSSWIADVADVDGNSVLLKLR